ncbi:AraC family transcriptional regulator [Gammaproteobacteria bacterium 45_16_T64]|nr:AraC family transcriptional regulator [Gammaproteobacteria bacterium 45_16_T64]
MRKVTIVGFDYAFASAITGVMDLLSMVGVTWNRIQNTPVEKQFEVLIATEDGRPVRCTNGIEIKAHVAISDIERTDLLLVPTIAGNISHTLAVNQNLLPWLRQQYEHGADIASNCTGAFLLAESGLLDNKKATTHWGYVDLFKQRYPLVNLQPEQLITADGSVFCSGGGMAWFDMALFLIERYCGHDVAMESAKSFVIDIGRDSQQAYTSVPGKKYHKDNAVLRLQDWMDANYQQQMSIERLAAQATMTERTLKRRFKIATGETPIRYLQSLRIDAAKKLLERSQQSVESITHHIGYNDVSSFIRLFKTHTGLSPSAYRGRFSRR